MTHHLPNRYFVLYADDDPDDIALVLDAFARYSNHVEVITAHDGFEALSFLRGIDPHAGPPPCLIILDINMPRLNGKETLKKIRDMDCFSEIPVVLFSTSSQNADKEFADRYQAGYLIKPLDARQVSRIAESFMAYCSDMVRNAILQNKAS